MNIWGFISWLYSWYIDLSKFKIVIKIVITLLARILHKESTWSRDSYFIFYFFMAQGKENHVCGYYWDAAGILGGNSIRTIIHILETWTKFKKKKKKTNADFCEKSKNALDGAEISSKWGKMLRLILLSDSITVWWAAKIIDGSIANMSEY